MAPLTAVTEYVVLLPEQIPAVPEILPGIAGMLFTVTARACAAELPQVLFEVTETFPLAVPAVLVIELPVDDPLQPDGIVQVYEVAPLTELME